MPSQASVHGNPNILVLRLSNVFAKFWRPHRLRARALALSIFFFDFRPITHYISQMIQDSAIVTMEGE